MKYVQSEATLIFKSDDKFTVFQSTILPERFLQTDLGQLYLSAPFA